MDVSERITRVHRSSAAKRPWNSAYSKSEHSYTPIHFPDEQEDIDLCINCPLPVEKCKGKGGCYKEAREYKRRKLEESEKRPTGRFDKDKFLWGIRNGLSTEQIASVFGVTSRTINKWRKKYDFLLDEEGGEDCKEKGAESSGGEDI